MGWLSERVRSDGYGALRQGRKVFALIAALGAGSVAGTVAAEVQVAALGDSLTAGYGLPGEDGFVPQLERWLQAQGHDVTVINAGVSGDTTAGGLSRTAWTLTPEVDALIVALGGNDVLRGIDPGTARANLRGILEAGQARGLPLMLVGIEAPGNFGPDYKAAFEAMYPELAAEFDAVLVPNFLEVLLALEDRVAARATYMQPDGIHPNAAGVALIVEDLGPSVATLVSRVTEPQ